MSFYEEIDREFKSAGIEGKIIPVPQELRPTPQDFAELDAKIEKRCEENRNMMFLSEIYSINSMPCGNVESIKNIKRLSK